MGQSIKLIVSGLFVMCLAPVLGDQAAAYAAGTTPNAMLETVFNLLAWGIPLAIGGGLLMSGFKAFGK